MGMDVDWPHKKRELGDEVAYICPNNKLTWEESAKEQFVRCIWHRQTDTMLWWPQNLHICNSKYIGKAILEPDEKIFTFFHLCFMSI